MFTDTVFYVLIKHIFKSVVGLGVGMVIVYIAGTIWHRFLGKG